MLSATCCGIKSRQSLVWTHHAVMYGINPKEDTRYRVIPYACGDYIHACGAIPYQPFGLDRKKAVKKRSFFLVHLQGERGKTTESCFYEAPDIKQGVKGANIGATHNDYVLRSRRRTRRVRVPTR